MRNKFFLGGGSAKYFWLVVYVADSCSVFFSILTMDVMVGVNVSSCLKFQNVQIFKAGSL